ncbi:MAG: rane protein, partial [Acidobacteria bacterium]|nr:rane protein [Acidobacteriota bacterium]
GRHECRLGEPVGVDDVRALSSGSRVAGCEGAARWRLALPGFHNSKLLTSLFLLLALAPNLFAHEIGTTQVHARFLRNHTFSIDVITAPQSLLGKVEIRARMPRTPALPPPQLRARLQALEPELAKAVDIRFGAAQITPHVEVLPIDRDAQPTSVTVRFTGAIPKQAGPFVWQYHLTFAAYALALENEGHGAPVRQWLDADQPSVPFPLSRDVLPPTRLEVVRQYLALGYTHIVPYGLDHILFVLGIFLLSTKLRPVLLQVTAFTIAHSITLGLTIYGLVHVSPRIVEPMIALSIAYVAIENLTTTQLKPWRVAIVFAFGLLHGMGFAGVLAELGLPRSEFLPALISFNVGVEAGQLSVIAAAYLLVAWWAQTRPWYRHRFVIPASAAIAAVGIFWTVQRIVG